MDHARGPVWAVQTDLCQWHLSPPADTHSRVHAVSFSEHGGTDLPGKVRAPMQSKTPAEAAGAWDPFTHSSPPIRRGSPWSPLAPTLVAPPPCCVQPGARASHWSSLGQYLKIHTHKCSPSESSKHTSAVQVRGSEHMHLPNVAHDASGRSQSPPQPPTNSGL